MDFRGKRKRIEPSFTNELIEAFLPFEKNEQISRAIFELKQIASLEKQQEKSLIVEKDKVLILLCLVTKRVKEVMHQREKATKFIELAKYCLENLPEETATKQLKMK